MLKDLWYTLCRSCKPRRSKTVRYAFPLFLLTLMFAGAAAVITDSESFISIETTPKNVAEGDLFFVDVSATVHVPVNAVEIEVHYPEDQMKVTGIDTGESVITLWTVDPYAKDGTVYLSGGTFRRGFLGKHLIARIRMEATNAGTAHVNTHSAKLVAGDGAGTEIAVTDAGFDATRMYIANEDGSLVGVASVFIVTDIDGDGSVDIKDISAFMSAWFNNSKIFDFNGDGKMNFRDFSILLADSFFK